MHAVQRPTAPKGRHSHPISQPHSQHPSPKQGRAQCTGRRAVCQPADLPAAAVSPGRSSQRGLGLTAAHPGAQSRGRCSRGGSGPLHAQAATQVKHIALSDCVMPCHSLVTWLHCLPATSMSTAHLAPARQAAAIMPPLKRVPSLQLRPELSEDAFSGLAASPPCYPACQAPEPLTSATTAHSLVPARHLLSWTN